MSSQSPVLLLGQDLRSQADQGAGLVSFKKGFDKDIFPATVSSWIKQNVLLCYELSDQEALTLHQVKAHDVRTFAASKAKKTPKNCDMLPLGGLFLLMSLNSSLSSPTSEQVCKKEGGRQCRYIPG